MKRYDGDNNNGGVGHDDEQFIKEFISAKERTQNKTTKCEVMRHKCVYVCSTHLLIEDRSSVVLAVFPPPAFVLLFC